MGLLVRFVKLNVSVISSQKSGTVFLFEQVKIQKIIKLLLFLSPLSSQHIALNSENHFALYPRCYYQKYKYEREMESVVSLTKKLMFNDNTNVLCFIEMEVVHNGIPAINNCIYKMFCILGECCVVYTVNISGFN